MLRSAVSSYDDTYEANLFATSVVVNIKPSVLTNFSSLALPLGIPTLLNICCPFIKSVVCLPKYSLARLGFMTELNKLLGSLNNGIRGPNTFDSFSKSN